MRDHRQGQRHVLHLAVPLPVPARSALRPAAFGYYQTGQRPDGPHPPRKGPRGVLLSPTDMQRELLDDGSWEVRLTFEITCGTQLLPVEAVLTDSRAGADGVPHSEPVQAFRHFCDANVARWERTAAIRSNVESIFSWIEQRFIHKDRVACWNRDHHLLDLVGARIAMNAEVWAHALPALRAVN